MPIARMPARLKDFVQKLGRLGIAFFALLLLYLLLYLAAPTSGFTAFLLFAVYVTGAVYGLRMLRRSVKRTIWRLRNRLIVAYLFIAVVPIALIVILVGIGAYILTGQAGVYLVGSELDRRTAALRRAAEFIASAAPDQRDAVIAEVAPFARERFPNVELLVHADQDRRFPENADISSPAPGWKDTSGIVLKDRRFYSWAHVVRPGVEVTAAAPLTADFLGELVPDLGEVFLYRGESDRKSVV